MARPNQETIDTFMSITGATEAVAVQRLEEHHGDLNEAVDAFFSDGDNHVVQHNPVVPRDDFMEVDDPLESQHRQTSSLLSAAGGLNPFSLLDPNFRRSLFDSRGFFDNYSDSTNRTPFVSHPREVREIPIEVKDENRPSSHGPAIEEVTDTERTQGPEIRGTVIIDDEDEEDISAPVAYARDQNERGGRAFHGPGPSAPDLSDVPDHSNDIEEQMIRAAIEASKKDAEVQQFGAENELNNAGSQQRGEVTEPARAVSLSLKAAEQERALHEQGTKAGASGPSGSKVVDVDEVGSIAEQKERQDSPAQLMKGAGSSSIQDEVEGLKEPPLVRIRSRHVSSSSVDAQIGVEGTEVSPPLSPPRLAGQLNGHTFPAEWGGISSEEHDEAVMLEAAMFGGIPENNRFHFPYAPHELMRSGSRAAPRPPSPGLTAQRLIREQQDDEYLASLQADREKELKAIQEEEAARQAALEENRQKEEAARRKIEEEEELERQLAAKEASLPEEPAADHENVVTLLVKMPDGSRRGRRFLRTHRLQSLFDFIDIGRGVKPGTYRVVRPFPRRAFSGGESASTLEELGLTSKQEALFLESI